MDEIIHVKSNIFKAVRLLYIYFKFKHRKSVIVCPRISIVFSFFKRDPSTPTMRPPHENERVDDEVGLQY